MSYMHVSFTVFDWSYKIISVKIYCVLRCLVVVMGLFGFKEVGRSEEVSFLTSTVHPNTEKEKLKNHFFPLFPFAQLFTHFQGATINFVII